MEDKKVICFVYQGNMLRSPIAERFFRKEVERLGLSPKIEVVSRGMQGAHDKNSPTGRRIQDYPIWDTLNNILPKFDIDMSDHKACPLTDDIVVRADLILFLATDDKNVKLQLYEEFPDAISKVYILTLQTLKGDVEIIEIQDVGPNCNDQKNACEFTFCLTGYD